MTSREELIEEVAKAMAILDDYDGCFERLAGTDPEEPLSTDEEDAEFWRKRARVALAVFEQAHTPSDDYPDAEGLAALRAQSAPTDDEREAVEFAQAQWPDLGVGGDAGHYNKIARARFLEGVEWQARRTVQGESTDAECVEIANRAQAVTGRSIWPSTVREVLRAAAAKQEGGNRG